MFLSNFFLPTVKETPVDAVIKSHIYSLRAGIVMPVASGLYSWLPLGLRVMQKVEKIIREEMAKINAHEILMPIVQPADLWYQSGRYDAYGAEMTRFRDRGERELLLAPTHEEIATEIFHQKIKSYKELPQNWYHIQWKFRDEIRPRSGVMRSREFLMKDGYSFDLTQEASENCYYNMYRAYYRIFSRMGVRCIAVKTSSSGPIGGSLNHEFHIVTATGDDSIIYDKRFDTMPTTDIYEYLRHNKLYGSIKEAWVEDETRDIETSNAKSIEVGHIFNFGQKYSQSLGAHVIDANDNKLYPFMGSYGIGVTRIVGAIIESSHDGAGIIWPLSVAPFAVGVVDLLYDGDIQSDVFQRLTNAGLEFLYDDTHDSAGVKFNRMDLIGLPWQITLGKKHEGQLEIKNRITDERLMLTIDEAMNFLKLKNMQEANTMA